MSFDLSDTWQAILLSLRVADILWYLLPLIRTSRWFIPVRECQKSGKSIPSWKSSSSPTDFSDPTAILWHQPDPFRHSFPRFFKKVNLKFLLYICNYEFYVRYFRDKDFTSVEWMCIDFLWAWAQADDLDATHSKLRLPTKHIFASRLQSSERPLHF